MVRRWAKFRLLALLALGLAGCATVPPPRQAGDSLVRGRLLLEFPEGFTGPPARVVSTSLLVHFVEEATGRRFARPAVQGCFVFRGAGGGRYLLRSVEFSARSEEEEYYLHDRVDLAFSCPPGAVVDLGQLRLVYSRPRASARVAAGRSRSLEVPDWMELEGEEELFLDFPIGRLRERYWSYQRSSRQEREPEALRGCRAERLGPWAGREVVLSPVEGG